MCERECVRVYREDGHGHGVVVEGPLLGQVPVVRELHRPVGRVDVRECKLPWREASPPYHHDDEVDSDQVPVVRELHRPEPEA